MPPGARRLGSADRESALWSFEFDETVGRTDQGEHSSEAINYGGEQGRRSPVFSRNRVRPSSSVSSSHGWLPHICPRSPEPLAHRSCLKSREYLHETSRRPITPTFALPVHSPHFTSFSQTRDTEPLSTCSSLLDHTEANRNPASPASRPSAATSIHPHNATWRPTARASLHPLKRSRPCPQPRSWHMFARSSISTTNTWLA